MIRRENGRVYECVVIDINTQRDFCDPNGTYPVANLQALLPALRRVIAWTKRNYAPIVSAIDSHRQSEVTVGRSHPCCIDGSPGQRKIAFTLFPSCAGIEVDNTLSISLDLFRDYQQVIFRERTDDLLSNPKADRFLTQLSAHEFVVFGNSLERSVKALALGLLCRHKHVAIVADACGYWNKAYAALALRQAAAKGATIITVDQLLSRKLSRRWRYPISSAARRSNGNTRHRSGTGNHRMGGHSPGRKTDFVHRASTPKRQERQT